MKKGVTVVGLDAHKVSINVAVLLAEAQRPIEWQVSSERGSVRRMVKKVLALAPGMAVRFCYEAGPCGYALQRWIRELGGWVHGSGAFAHPQEARGANQDRPARRSETGRASASWALDRGVSA